MLPDPLAFFFTSLLASTPLLGLLLSYRIILINSKRNELFKCETLKQGVCVLQCLSATGTGCEQAVPPECPRPRLQERAPKLTMNISLHRRSTQAYVRWFNKSWARHCSGITQHLSKPLESVHYTLFISTCHIPRQSGMSTIECHFQSIGFGWNSPIYRQMIRTFTRRRYNIFAMHSGSKGSRHRSGLATKI